MAIIAEKKLFGWKEIEELGDLEHRYCRDGVWTFLGAEPASGVEKKCPVVGCMRAGAGQGIGGGTSAVCLQSVSEEPHAESAPCSGDV